MIKRVLTSLLMCLFLISLNALAQETTGSIQGEVKDPQGLVVPGVKVNINSRAFTLSVTTDSAGFFRAKNVPPGIYTVSVAAAAGFGEATVDNVEVVLGKTAVVPLTLPVAGTTTTVEVTAIETPVALTDSKIQTNITTQAAELLPKGVNFTSLLKIAPSTRPESLSGGFQVDGASGSENTFVVDGQEVTHFRTGVLRANDNLPFSIVQETQIKTSGFEAEYGGATGGVVNVVTKSGSNDWHGEFGASFAPSQLQVKPNQFLRNFRTGSATATPSTFIDIPEYIQPRKDEGTNYYPTATVSGPMIKDRLWFFAAYSPQIENTHRTLDYISPDPRTRTISETLTYNVRRIREFSDVRLDGSPDRNGKLRLTGRFIWAPIHDEGAVPAFTDMTAAPPQAVIEGQTLRGPAFLDQQGGRQNSNNVTGSATWTPSATVLVNARAGRTFLNEKLNSYGIPRTVRYLCNASSSTSAAAAAGCAPGQQNFASNFQYDYDVSTRTTFDGDGSIFVDDFAGRHQFKFGYQYNGLANRTSQGYADIGLLVMYWGTLTMADLTGQAAAPGAIGAGYLQRFGTIGKASSANQAIYVQDSWQPISRLSLNLGIRLEREDVPSFSPPNPGILFDWGSKPAPRLGFALDPTGSGKHKIFGSFGWFYDRFKYELPRGSFGGDFYRRDYFDLFPADRWNTIT
ncbi:MAG: TonB-dependent receptor, partial [Acidobacteria bacterium]|nr:TonB-dependent receptor [Acidobacteriota bacterium]